MDRHHIFFSEDVPLDDGGITLTQYRILFIITVFITLCSCFFILYNYYSIQDSFNNIEEQEMNQLLRGVNATIQNYAVILSQKGVDYSENERLIRYLTRDTGVLPDDQVRSLFVRNRLVNYVLITDATHSPVYQRYIDLENRTRRSIPEGIPASYPFSSPETPLLWAGDDGSLMLIVSEPVLKETNPDRVVGHITLGTLLNKRIEQGISSDRNTSLKIFFQDNSGRISPDGYLISLNNPVRSRISEQNSSVIRGEVSIGEESTGRKVQFDIEREKRILEYGMGIADTYLIQSLIFSLAILVIGIILIILLFRRYAHVQAILKIRDSEQNILQERRYLLDQFQAILDCHLRFGPDADENIGGILSTCGRLIGADSGFYARIDDDHLRISRSWQVPPDFLLPELSMEHILAWIHEGNEDFREISISSASSPEACPLPGGRGIHLHILKKISLHSEPVGVLGFFSSSEKRLSDVEKIVLELLSNSLSIEEGRREGRITLKRRDAVLEAVSYAATRLMMEFGASTIPDILGRLAETIGVSEAHIFSLSDTGNGILIPHSVISPDRTGKSDDYIPFSSDTPFFSRFADVLKSGEIIAGPVDSFPGDEREILEKTGIRSLVIVPFFSRRDDTGVLCLLDYSSRRRWHADELEALKTAAGLLGATFARIKSEKEVRQSEQKFSTAFHSNQVLLSIRSIRTGRLIDANETYFSSLGYSRDELVGRMPDNPRIFEDISQFNHIQEEILENGFIRDYEVILQTKTNEILYGSLYGVMIPISEESAVLYSVVNITDRKEAEIRVANLLEILSISNKELQDFAHIVSHDLKAPLRGIHTLVTWISEDFKDSLDQKGKEHLLMLLDQVRHMSELIDGVLAYSQAAMGHEEIDLVNISEVVNDVIQVLSPPPSTRIIIDTPLPSLFTEKTKIVQVFQNLIGNAIVHMNRPDGIIRISAEKKDTMWEFHIRDNGPGIDPLLHKRIFEIFQTGRKRSEYQGTGLGLAIVKKIVGTSGGDVWVVSVPGEGSEFIFTLPGKGDYAA